MSSPVLQGLDETAIVAEFVELAHRIAPVDLAERPLYVVQVSHCDRWEDVVPPNTWGLAGGAIDLAFRDVIEATQRWKGRGRAIVWNDLAFAATSLSQQEFRRRSIATMLHEFAHAMECDVVADQQVNDALIGMATAEHKEDIDRLHSVGRKLPPWAGHGLSWIRICHHLVMRCQSLGVEVSIVDVCDSQRYKLPRAYLFRHLLRDELIDMADASFAEIRSTPPPVPAVNAYVAALHDWLKSRENPGPLDAAVVAAEVSQWARRIAPLTPAAA